MSTTLVWDPVIYREKSLNTETKFVLRKRYGDPINCRIGTIEDKAFLEGLLSAGTPNVQKDANALLAALEKYDEIDLRETS